MEIIDFFTQPYTGNLSDLLPERARSKTRSTLEPVSSLLHEARPFFRFVPGIGRRLLEKAADHVLHAPFLLLESSARDLQHAMVNSNVARAVVLPEFPRSTNDFILDLCLRNPPLIPGVEIAGIVDDPLQELRNLKNRGAKILKVATDRAKGLPLKTHQDLVAEAARLKMPVILTSAKDLEALISASSGGTLVIAHMAGDHSDLAIDVAQNFDHVFLETSRQPIEVWVEAIRRVGAERLLYGSDWPKIGNNMSVSLKQVREGVRSQMIKEDDAKKILGGNARKLLEDIGHANPT